MASKSMSPQGALLRASRMFAMPPPLQKPQGELSSTQTRNSDTATTIHPLYQTITTTPASLAKGDWGFKRPFPLRSTTKSSTPLLRVEQVDTIEHITQYASAADHSLTLKKWQELSIPVSTPSAKEKTVTGASYKNSGKGKSVFEDNVDVTAEYDDVLGKDGHRWKFNGPWLAGQTEGDFNDYLAKKVRGKKAQFQHFLREQLLRRINAANLKESIENGNEALGVPLKPSDISEEAFRDYLREIRNDQTELFQHIRKFFDLAPSPSAATEQLGESFLQAILDRNPSDDLPTVDATKYQDPKSDSPYAAKGPPKTHPSAGLSYLRSASYLTNHPIHGPQAKKAPVEARLITPKAAGHFSPKIGIAGFVANLPSSVYGFNASNLLRNRRPNEAPPPSTSLDPQTPGGTKLWVHPSTATVDPEGRIVVESELAADEAVAVKKGTTEELAKITQRPAISPQPYARRWNGNGDYGLGSF